MIFRLSQKLAKKVKVGKLPEMPLAENPYADWSCHVFTANRTQHIILSNTASMYSCVMFGKGITDDSRFIDRALTTIREFMEDDGEQFAYRKFVKPEGETISFARPLNRSVTGSMNELIMAAEMYLIEDEMAPHDVGFKLNGLLLSILKDGEGRKYGEPKDAFKRLPSNPAK